jgi:hypothetical protein
MRGVLYMLALVACNPDPGEVDQQVGYRDGLDGGANSGERGNLNISEVMWSGSVTNAGVWDPSDQFVEIRNEGNRAINLSGWFIEMEGTANTTWPIPTMEEPLLVGEHLLIAAKTSGCFPDADLVISDLAIPYGDPFKLTLVDRDERLIEPAGSKTMPPYAGGFDGVKSRSMEKVQLMFGGRGSEPHSWHYYTDLEVDIPNDDRISPDCVEQTRASPGRPNSPDYSGAYASGSFE